MLDEKIELQVERYYNMLYTILRAYLPRYTGYNEPHPYAEGNLMKSMSAVKTATGWRIIIDVPYAELALGLNEDGSKRNPRGVHEAHNFNILDTCIELTNKTLGGNFANVRTK